MMSEIYLCNLTLKTKEGTYTEKEIIYSEDKEILTQRIYRGKLEKFKNSLIKDANGFPIILKVERIKKIGT